MDMSIGSHLDRLLLDRTAGMAKADRGAERRNRIAFVFATRKAHQIIRACSVPEVLTWPVLATESQKQSVARHISGFCAS